MEWTLTERQHLAASVNHLDRAEESFKARGKWRRRDQLSYVSRRFNLVEISQQGE